jgi:hypothetical protein
MTHSALLKQPRTWSSIVSNIADTSSCLVQREENTNMGLSLTPSCVRSDHTHSHTHTPEKTHTYTQFRLPTHSHMLFLKTSSQMSTFLCVMFEHSDRRWLGSLMECINKYLSSSIPVRDVVVPLVLWVCICYKKQRREVLAQTRLLNKPVVV